MPKLDEETLGKLATSLAGDIVLYNKVIDGFKEDESAITEVKTELEQTQAKLAKAEETNAQYIGQIGNLLSRLPITENNSSPSMEQKIEEIKQTGWTK